MLQDPNAADDAVLVIDRVRFEEAWSGDVILVKRNYDISDENQPFSIGLIAALIFRERWVVRDVAICAIVLSFLALSPIMFWRLLSDKVIYFKAYNTFFVVCLAMVVLVIFEAVFAYVRQFLIVHLTTRVDVKLATYMFDKVLNLPMDFFERTQTGKITYDIQPDVENSHFPDGAAFRDRFGFHDIAGVPAGHVLLQSDHDADRFGDMRADGALDRRHAAGLPSQIQWPSKPRNPSAARFWCRRSTAFAPSSRWRSMRANVTSGT